MPSAGGNAGFRYLSAGRTESAFVSTEPTTPFAIGWHGTLLHQPAGLYGETLAVQVLFGVAEIPNNEATSAELFNPGQVNESVRPQ